MRGTTHQFASTNPFTICTLHIYLNTRHEDTWYHHLISANVSYFVIWHTPMNQSHRPDSASVTRPHGVPPWINPIDQIYIYISPIAQIQPLSYASMAHPHKSIPSPDPASFKFPFKCLNPTKITNWTYALYTFFSKVKKVKSQKVLPHTILALVTLQWPHCDDNRISVGASTETERSLQQRHSGLKPH